MLDFIHKLNALIDNDSIFWFCALAGSGMFIIQFILTLLGADQNESIEDSSIDAGNFKWMSKQAVTGFVMMFGWVGLTCIKEFDLSGIATALIAFGCGVISVFVTGFIFKSARKLRSSGTVFRLEDAIGKEATVYQRIAKGGAGKISISLHNFTHEIDAISSHPDDLHSFTSVRIIKIADEKTVIVVPTK